MNETASLRARAEIDLAALRANVRALRERAAGAQLMAVVKSDGYGHGAVPCARAAREAGATWLGTATPHEALALRAAGLDGRIMCWLWTPGGPWREAIEAGIDVSVSALWSLREAVAGAAAAGRPARVQLKADTGLGRAGCQPADWPALVAEARAAERTGAIRITGLWSHLACADEPGHPSIGAQLSAFRDMVAYAEKEGVDPEVRHLANSPATLTLPETHFDLVRTGIAMYGISPAPELGTPAELGLRPVMTLAAAVALVKDVPAGHGVSYGHHYATADETTLGLIPVGYADGIPRHASGRGPVLVGGRVRTAAGRVAMDQFVVDLGGDRPEPGAEALLFGPGDRGEPSVEDWAVAADTIGYEIVTRIGTRVPRVYVNESAGAVDGSAGTVGRASGAPEAGATSGRAATVNGTGSGAASGTAGTAGGTAAEHVNGAAASVTMNGTASATMNGTVASAPANGTVSATTAGTAGPANGAAAGAGSEAVGHVNGAPTTAHEAARTAPTTADPSGGPAR